jgi:hypothetical protein
MPGKPIRNAVWKVQGGLFIVEHGYRDHLVFGGLGRVQKVSVKRTKAGEAPIESKDKMCEKIIIIKLTCSWGYEKRKLMNIEQWRMVGIEERRYERDF